MCEKKDGKVVSFINMKGGVGKTTLAINIGYTLVKHFQKNVLIIDMDPQFNATQALMSKFFTIEAYQKMRENNQTIASLLTNSTKSMVNNNSKSFNILDVITTLYSTDESKFDLIPGDLALTEFESTQRGAEKILGKQIVQYDLASQYDYVLIDTPATYSIYSQASLYASSYYVVPIAPDVFSALGYELLQKALSNDLVLDDHPLTNLGVLFNLTKGYRNKRANIQSSFENEKRFKKSLEEYENIRTGNIGNFIYDMSKTQKNIVELTQEFIEKLEDI
ncbi:ParA family protein [Ligilactobacillus animalis]|uniref:ParA family protein n=1 Tax=Ligilactobacillus animalis TaxID=1605 RepID=UPI002902DD2A|nr:ParA family protein [Ligilactobacillus animalis]MDU1487949.1 ParA family protein [Ligilactobacillus animalis]